MRRRRDEADIARFAVSTIALAITALLRYERPASLRNLSIDLIRLAAWLPDTVQVAVVGATQLAAVVAAVVIIAMVVAGRRWVVLAPTALSALFAGVLSALTAGWISRTSPPVSLHLPRPSWIIGPNFPSATYLAVVVAAVVTASPTWTRKWRRTAWIGVAMVALSRILTAATVPLGIGTAVLLGISVGSAVLVIVGIPRLGPSLDDLAAALDRLGLTVSGIRSVEGQRPGQFRYSGQAEGKNGEATGPVEIWYIDRNNRDADLFARAINALRVRGVEEEQSGLSPARITEHAALVTLLAYSHGVPVNRVIAVGEDSSGAGILVLEAPSRESMLQIGAERLSPQMLGQAWESLNALHGIRIAHRRANLNHVTTSDDGQAVWTGLRHATIGASEQLMALDRAEFLVSTALVVGVGPAIDAARSVSDEDLVSTLPLIQKVILTPQTRRAVNRHDSDNDGDIVDEVRVALSDRIGVEDVELAALQRITKGKLLGLVLGTVVIYAALSFASNLTDLGESLREFSWTYLPALIVAEALTYPLLALSLMGATPQSLPFVTTTRISLAQTILNRFTPANAGGMALRLRYLQRMGMEVEPAATALGLTSAFSGVAQVIVLSLFAVWAGSSGELSFSLPTNLIAPAVLVISLASGLLYLMPWGRRLWTERVLPSLKRAWPVIRELFQSPEKLVLLVASNLGEKLVTVGAFALAANSVGLDLSFAQLGFLYMTANTVAGAAPTPGGLGAIEAALTAALTSTGVPTAQALSVVLVFRLTTFWAPIPFSAVSLARVRKAGLV